MEKVLELQTADWKNKPTAFLGCTRPIGNPLPYYVGRLHPMVLGQLLYVSDAEIW